jgi:hypothetical protein
MVLEDLRYRQGAGATFTDPLAKLSVDWVHLECPNEPEDGPARGVRRISRDAQVFECWHCGKRWDRYPLDLFSDLQQL